MSGFSLEPGGRAILVGLGRSVILACRFSDEFLLSIEIRRSYNASILTRGSWPLAGPRDTLFRLGFLYQLVVLVLTGFGPSWHERIALHDWVCEANSCRDGIPVFSVLSCLADEKCPLLR